jgi:signal peptidase I
MKKISNKIKKTFKILLYIFIIVLILRTFFFEAFRIPTSSMENTLIPGDFIIAGKFTYNLTTPREIPVTGWRIPYACIFEIGKPEINDIVIFELPRGFNSSALGDNSKFVKRIIAGPHDTLQIINCEIFVNGKSLQLPSTFKISKDKERGGWIKDESIYPPGSKWNKDNYGPIVIPAKGDTIKISPETFERWRSVIVFDYGERSLLSEGTIVTLGGRVISEYVLTQDHYFVIGDNFDLSLDSRHFGFVTDNMIVGKAMFVYWSYNPDSEAPGVLGFLSAIRAKRIFRGLN